MSWESTSGSILVLQIRRQTKSPITVVYGDWHAHSAGGVKKQPESL